MYGAWTRKHLLVGSVVIAVQCNGVVVVTLLNNRTHSKCSLAPPRAPSSVQNALERVSRRFGLHVELLKHTE